jgi:hypothetical protein
MRALCIDHVRTEGGIRVAGLGFWWCAYVYTYPTDAVPEALVEGGGGEQHLRQAGDPADGAVEPQAVSPVGEPVQPLRPPFVRRHAQPRHPRRLSATPSPPPSAATPGPPRRRQGPVAERQAARRCRRTAREWRAAHRRRRRVQQYCRHYDDHRRHCAACVAEGGRSHGDREKMPRRETRVADG